MKTTGIAPQGPMSAWGVEGGERGTRAPHVVPMGRQGAGVPSPPEGKLGTDLGDLGTSVSPSIPRSINTWACGLSLIIAGNVTFF